MDRRDEGLRKRGGDRLEKDRRNRGIFGVEEKRYFQRYFYLVVKESDPEGSLPREDEQSFFRSGVNTSSDYIFVFIDISTDHRLENDLRKKDGGDRFYERLNLLCPAFLISDTPIQQVVNVDQIEVHPIKDYQNDVAVIYERMGLEKPSTRKSFINFLRRVNRYSNLKPNILGVGANMNEILADWINRLERNFP